jgi:hypothetical protein
LLALVDRKAISIIDRHRFRTFFNLRIPTLFPSRFAATKFPSSKPVTSPDILVHPAFEAAFSKSSSKSLFFAFFEPTRPS